MEIILAFVVVENSPCIAFGHCAVEIAYQKLIVFTIEIDLSFQDSRVVRLKSNHIFSIVKVQLLKDFLVRQHRMHIAIFIQMEINPIDQHIVDEYSHPRPDCMCAKASQEGSRDTVAVSPLYD